MPFRSMTSGTLSPEPSLTGAPYKLGDVIDIECHNGKLMIWVQEKGKIDNMKFL